MSKPPHVEGPDFDRMAEDRKIFAEAKEDRAEIKKLSELVLELNRKLVMKDVEINDWIGRYNAMGAMVDVQAGRANGLEIDLKRLWHFAGCPFDHCQRCVDDAKWIKSLEGRLGPPSAASVQAQHDAR